MEASKCKKSRSSQTVCGMTGAKAIGTIASSVNINPKRKPLVLPKSSALQLKPFALLTTLSSTAISATTPNRLHTARARALRSPASTTNRRMTSSWNLSRINAELEVERKLVTGVAGLAPGSELSLLRQTTGHGTTDQRGIT